MSGQNLVIILGIGAAVAALWAWVAGARVGRAAEASLQSAARGGGLAGRALLSTAVIIAVQWIVLRVTTDPTVTMAVLMVPAAVTGFTVGRALAGPSVVRSTRGGSR
jgi:hypothetical protein